MEETKVPLHDPHNNNEEEGYMDICIVSNNLYPHNMDQNNNRVIELLYTCAWENLL